MHENDSPRKIEKSEKTRQRLYDSAAGLFSKREFSEVSVESIVEAAGVSKGTFYNYFDSKDALIATFFADYVEKLDTDYMSAVAAVPKAAPVAQKLIALAENICDVLENQVGRQGMATAYKLLLNGSFDMNSIKGYDRRLYGIFYDLAEEGKERGQFRPAPSSEILARHLVMAIRGLCYEWCIRYPDFDLKAQTTEHFRLLLSGIQQSGGESPEK